MIQKLPGVELEDLGSKSEDAPGFVPDERFIIRELRILDPAQARDIIEDRMRRGLDKYDEVWDGVYVMPAAPNLWHQDLAHDLAVIFDDPIKRQKLGLVQESVNVSDRREDWETNYRIPDVVIVLKGGKAIHCDTHWFGGPDFLVEIESKHDESDKKLVFYGEIGVRELLTIHRDLRTLRLYRHNGRKLTLIGRSTRIHQEWLVSEVIPFAFRYHISKRTPKTEVKRTDKKRQKWTI